MRLRLLGWWFAALLFALPAAPRAAAGPKPAPNVVIDFSAALVNRTMQRTVDRTEPVSDVIQDTPVTGWSRALGTVHAELVPSATCGMVDVVLRSRVYAQGVAQRPHLLLYTNSVTPLEVRRRIVLDACGIRLVPLLGSADTCSQLVDIKCRKEPDHLALRAGIRGFEVTREAAEIETSIKAGNRAASKLTEELTTALAPARQAVGDGIRNIQRVGLSLELLEFSTTPAFLQARLRIAGPRRREPGPVPNVADNFDLGLRIHDSLINDAAQAIYGNASIRLDETSNFYEEVTQRFLSDARNDAERKDGLKKLQGALAALGGKGTSLTLASNDPITIHFADQGFTAEIHLATIRQNGSVYSGLRVRARYRVEATTTGVYVVREGPIQFLPPAAPMPPEKALPPPPAFFSLVQEVLFDEVLKERFVLAELPYLNAIEGVQFLPPRVGVRDGWLAIAWTLRPGASAR
jgi:hypothetical protein